MEHRDTATASRSHVWRWLAALVPAVVVAALLSPLGSGVANAAPFTTDDLTGGTPTPTTLASSLAGQGVTVSNVTYVGSDSAAGTFAGGSGIIDFDTGIVLSSGDIADIVGPNSSDGTSVNQGTPGDPDLDLLTTSSTNDAAVLEFDFVPNAATVFFSYVFGSEEYNEWVNSTYNDVFGFFVTAAGATTKANCAVLPDGPDADTNPDPVTINTVNNGDPFGTAPNSHPELYRNNDPNDPAATIDTGMDGLTVTLVCQATVVAGQPNHLKLAIADVADARLDSYVLLQAGSLTTVPSTTTTIPSSSTTSTPTSSTSTSSTSSTTVAPTSTTVPTTTTSTTSGPGTGGAGIGTGGTGTGGPGIGTGGTGTGGAAFGTGGTATGGNATGGNATAGGATATGGDAAVGGVTATGPTVVIGGLTVAGASTPTGTVPVQQAQQQAQAQAQQQTQTIRTGVLARTGAAAGHLVLWAVVALLIGITLRYGSDGMRRSALLAVAAPAVFRPVRTRPADTAPTAPGPLDPAAAEALAGIEAGVSAVPGRTTHHVRPVLRRRTPRW